MTGIVLAVLFCALLWLRWTAKGSALDRAEAAESGDHPPATDTSLREIESKQLEGIKALADWSKWIVSIQTTLVGGLVVALVTKDLHDPAPMWEMDFLIGALVCFVVSIIAATILLGAIPPAMEGVPIRSKSGGSYDLYDFRVGRFLMLRLAGIQGPAFVFGLLLGVYGFLAPAL
jgi:hypothetical protein